MRPGAWASHLVMLAIMEARVCKPLQQLRIAPRARRRAARRQQRDRPHKVAVGEQLVKVWQLLLGLPPNL